MCRIAICIGVKLGFINYRPTRAFVAVKCIVLGVIYSFLGPCAVIVVYFSNFIMINALESNQML